MLTKLIERFENTDDVEVLVAPERIEIDEIRPPMRARFIVVGLSIIPTIILAVYMLYDVVTVSDGSSAAPLVGLISGGLLLLLPLAEYWGRKTFYRRFEFTPGHAKARTNDEHAFFYYDMPIHPIRVIIRRTRLFVISSVCIRQTDSFVLFGEKRPLRACHYVDYYKRYVVGEALATFYDVPFEPENALTSDEKRLAEVWKKTIKTKVLDPSQI